MPDIIEVYGKNAGKVWKTLETCGQCNTTTIIKNTGLTQEDFYVAVGWLARENKVWFKEDTYELKPANYENYIGENAGKVWHILNTYNELDETYIPKLAGVTEKDAFYAIGWLAKEGKISATKVKPKKVQTKYRLK
jgi:hypothetical protein